VTFTPFTVRGLILRYPLLSFNSFAAGGNYSRPHSLAAVGDYRCRIYAIYVGGTTIVASGSKRVNEARDNVPLIYW